MVRLYIIGVSILIVVIVCNFIVSKLGITSWYDFLENITKNEPNNLSLIDCLWLFLLYPLCLSLGYLLGDYISNLING